MKFDGKGFAREIGEQVKARVAKLERKPKIVSILVGNDPASVLYTRLKKEAAERVGIEFEVAKIEPRIANTELRNFVVKMASRADVTGLMIQLPVPGLQGLALKEVLSAIPYDKDVDGLRYPESGMEPPVVNAILRIMDNIASNQKLEMKNLKIVVVGAKGFVGSGVMEQLSKRGIITLGVERGDDMSKIVEGDIVISAVGEAGVIKPEMIKAGAVVIDVGSPAGDMTSEVYQKASVSVEVPGGVGPVTIIELLQQAVKLVI